MSIKDPIEISHGVFFQQVLQLMKMLDFPTQMTLRKITVYCLKNVVDCLSPLSPCHPLLFLFSLFRLQKHCARKTASHAYRH